MKRVAITMGDPAGVGPEVVSKAIPAVSGECLPVVIGDLCVLKETVNISGVPLNIKVIDDINDASVSPDTLWCMDLGSLTAFKRGMPDASNGRASVAYIRRAVDLAMQKEVDAIVTAPVSKEALRLAGFSWPGHTEMLSELTGAVDYAMMFVGGPLRVTLATIHVPLKDVPALITKRQVLKTIRLAKRACDMLGIERPVIAVAGLNPHAGESGIMGMEEIREIIPAIEEASRGGIDVKGPFPPDVVFYRAYRREVDMVVCMYHDQGLIPLKMVAFDRGVNVTVGLPIIRTSPDHGTAYDIAWRGIADPSSMIEAIRLAIRLRLC